MMRNPDANGVSVFDKIAGDERAQTNAEVAPSLAEEAAILRDHKHPLWQEMRERFESRLLANDVEEFA